MVVAVGSWRKRDCERRRSFQSFGGGFGPLDRETLQPDLGLVGCKTGGPVACSRSSLPVGR